MSGTETHEMVPEGFDLDSARRKWSDTDNDDRQHCPACERMSIVSRVNNADSHGADTDYYCSKCGATFDEPISHEEADWR